MTLRFKSDTPLRRRLYVPDSMAHPAKGHLGLWAELIQMYSRPGDLVLDPMAGIGTSLVAALMGRSVICVELEGHFVEPMRRSWEKMRQHPMLGCEMGQVVILQGDARCLPLPDASVGAAITSPPYEGFTEPNDEQRTHARASKKEVADGLRFVERRGYTRPVDAIVTSPPYAESNSTGGDQFRHIDRDCPPVGRGFVPPGNDERPYTGYSRPVDAIVTSPPYEGLRQDGGVNDLSVAKQDFHSYTNGITAKSHEVRGGQNIGNQKGAAYWESMSACYAECWRVLRPGGIMALVLKGFTRDGQYVDLPGQTEALLLEAGWQKHDHWRRELWSLSFWRVLQATDKEEKVVAHRRSMFDLDIQEVRRMKRVLNGKLDDRLRFEEVHAFRKGGC